VWDKKNNNKACGDDLVINEYIKSTPEKFIELYEKMFNLIFQSGVISDSWLNGNMKPIHKNKGCKTYPQNCRPITVLSCLGKLFTLSQVKDWWISCTMWKPVCFGRYILLWTIYLLFFTLFSNFKKIRKKLYCAFVDFAKAFSLFGEMGSGTNYYIIIWMEICLM